MNIWTKSLDYESLATTDTPDRPVELPDIEIRAIAKSFNGMTALDEVSFTVERGEFLAIMGPSGCGKTTLLRILAGLETADSGTLLSRGKRIDQIPVHRRNMRLVWQNYALFPHLNVRNNIEFGLKLQKLERRVIDAKVAAIAEMVRLTEFLDHRVTVLSGGQRQRVAIARALVTEPDILLLDEPLSALDANLRVHMQSELKRLQQTLGIAFVYITHNQSEAFSTADRVVVMNRGRIEQIGAPREIYLWPRTRFAAEFVGSNNLLEGRIASVDGNVVSVDCGAGRFFVALPDERLAHGYRPAPKATVTLVIQASKVRGHATGVANENQVTAVVTDTEFTGSQIVQHLRLEDGTALRMIAPDPFSGSTPGPGSTIDVYWSPEDCVLVGPRILPSSQNIPGTKSYVRMGG
ncbi:MAG: ABC transporter ATP-binding protein [Mesorhizobium sp.]|nr:MAG: ABC transporter ATP-binding protein [Mesorhizobium sp.]RWC61821.1 MAG: ABC transporter ATP-binding protein [Mesorhizobium sp.]RWC66400.1 MAG: ABC transporter ATP-binding protein [Mesorhizobium sp.]